MDILVQLGVTHTYFYQFVIFVFAIFVLSQGVFKDFVQLLDKREHETKGSETLAEEEQKKSAELHKEYEERARRVNAEIRTIFDTYRTEANEEYQSIIQRARSESQKIVDETRHRVSVEIGDAARKLKDEAPLVAQAMTTKLLSGEKVRG